jgi:hypothetical protein
MAEKITASFNQMTNNFVEAFETLLERTEL